MSKPSFPPPPPRQISGGVSPLVLKTRRELAERLAEHERQLKAAQRSHGAQRSKGAGWVGGLFGAGFLPFAKQIFVVCPCWSSRESMTTVFVPLFFWGLAQMKGFGFRAGLGFGVAALRSDGSGRCEPEAKVRPALG